MCTFVQSLDRYKASSAAESPAPTIATSVPLKKNPSQTAQAETPLFMNSFSESKPNHFALAPVEITTV